MQSLCAGSAPARTSAPVPARLHEVITQLAISDDFRARLMPLGFEPVTNGSPAAFGTYITQREGMWRSLLELSCATLGWASTPPRRAWPAQSSSLL
jgi:tripartite-type tricarboxylate transporter receptor subunit TctC